MEGDRFQTGEGPITGPNDKRKIGRSEKDRGRCVKERWERRLQLLTHKVNQDDGWLL